VGSIATAALARAALPAFADPRYVALRLGYRLALGHEPSTADLLVYDHHTEPRLLGGRIWYALACGLACRARIDVDEVALCHALALPPVACVGLAVDEVVRRQVHYPAYAIRYALAARTTADTAIGVSPAT